MNIASVPVSSIKNRTSRVPDGEGSYQWKNGDRYVGQWKNGAKDGRGMLSWANGDQWEGVFRADAQTEQGTLTRAAVKR